MVRKVIRENSGTRKERQGLFSQAGNCAVKAARAASLPLTYVEGIHIIREINGEKEIIGTVKPQFAVNQRKFNLSK